MFSYIIIKSNIISSYKSSYVVKFRLFFAIFLSLNKLKFVFLENMRFHIENILHFGIFIFCRIVCAVTSGARINRFIASTISDNKT